MRVLMRLTVYLVAGLAVAALAGALVVAATRSGDDHDPSSVSASGQPSAADRPAPADRGTVGRRNPRRSDRESDEPRPGDPPAADAHAGDSRPPLTDDELWADIADPAHSDLPPDVFQAAADTAAAVITADTTGEGRDRWPNYWHGARGQPCCRQVTIHAAGARRHPDHPQEARATVVWSGDPRPEVPGTFREKTAHVHLTRDDDGDWRPTR